MGNRAVITTYNGKHLKNSNEIGIYLHWNGGRDSVEAFLKYCKLRGFRPPEQDNYGWARLCQVIANYLGGGLSIGIDKCCNLHCNNFNNGTYIIKDWQIVGRRYFEGFEQDVYPLEEMLLCIDQVQPENEQLGEEFFGVKEVATDTLVRDDEVFMFDAVCDKYKKYKVVGFGNKDKVVNGQRVFAIPYVNRYPDDQGNYDWNINNYILDKTVRKVSKTT